ncbi:DEAD-domain-containing protein [Lophiostoma macrostomum CBS 122681]|uniref:ATP-dependent RNA helicase n=1 Tax=Lophiostoma macrostomum CBS 122681 TaxID=1314788 RepID=A0A6A6STT9_9PLEO|nr:DEAD-domain-containing protein [Lophiostoma macrostomum CBS 122681]
MPPPPPPSGRKNNLGRQNRRPYPPRRPAANAPENGVSPAQQPARPVSVATGALEEPKAMDPRRLYSTSAGESEAKPFKSLGNTLDESLLAGLDKMGFEYMSPVQQKVLTELPSLSSDCLVQAKTGTGKTAAFLLPAIQNLLSAPPTSRLPKGKVGILAICPTRELALQIAKECTRITQSLPQQLECHTAFGGTSRALSLKIFLAGNPTILVATPGRLNDILSEAAVREKFSHLKTVVLDEADRMLDAGFAPAIHTILSHLPSKTQSPGWQGMCFSATLPPKVSDVVKCVLYPGYTRLSTIDPNEAPTIDRVPQYSIVVPSPREQFPALLALVEAEYAAAPAPKEFKAIVFGTTANGVALLYDVFKAALPAFTHFELHSRMSQPARTRTTTAFKNVASGILFASDVVGRGMDFPNTGLVVQLGLPSSEEQYIHRVGRTARAGKDGRAVTILFSNEAFFVKTNRALPIKPYPTPVTSDLEKYQAQIDKAFTLVDDEAKAKAYQAFLGYNKTYLKKLQLDAKGLVQLANGYARAMGCAEIPLIEKKTIGKMGLKGVPGLNIGVAGRRL